jgi:hypothetical protein
MAVHKLTIKTKRISETADGKKVSNATSGANVRVQLDGEDLRGCHKLTFTVSAGKPARVVLEMLAEVELELDAEADLFDAEPGAKGAIGPRLDDIAPRGTVEVQCQGVDKLPDSNAGACVDKRCRSFFWVDALDPRLPDGPFRCYDHSTPEEQAAMDKGLKAPTPEEEAAHAKEAKEN